MIPSNSNDLVGQNPIDRHQIVSHLACAVSDWPLFAEVGALEKTASEDDAGDLGRFQRSGVVWGAPRTLKGQGRLMQKRGPWTLAASLDAGSILDLPEARCPFWLTWFKHRLGDSWCTWCFNQLPDQGHLFSQKGRLCLGQHWFSFKLVELCRNHPFFDCMCGAGCLWSSGVA